VVCLPDLPAFDIETVPSLDFITSCKFLEHGGVVRRIVACHMSDLELISE
jgi:hypothetical protein